jgi:exonuclease III
LINPRIVIWNVRGLNSVAQQDSLRTLVESSRADIVCIQETKIANLSQRVILSALGHGFSDYVVLPAAGASGGVLVAWKQHLQATGNNRVDTNSISVQFHSNVDMDWWLTCVYGPQGNDEKIAFLQELREVRSVCLGSWMVAGDFNLIYKDEDKNNSNYNRAMMGRFRRFINDLALRDPSSWQAIHLVESARVSHLSQIR